MAVPIGPYHGTCLISYSVFTRIISGLSFKKIFLTSLSSYAFLKENSLLPFSMFIFRPLKSHQDEIIVSTNGRTSLSLQQKMSCWNTFPKEFLTPLPSYGFETEIVSPCISMLGFIF
jgi:hypothetical protein